MTDQQFCLRWNNHQSTLVQVFDALLENNTLVDCTLAADGRSVKAHKVVLCACSPYLEALLSEHYEKHPILILKDVKFQELRSMLDYMYKGEVNISQDQLGTFLKAAESLQIKGLTDGSGDGDSRDVGSTQPITRHEPQRQAQRTQQSRSPAVLPSHSSNLTIEPSSRRSHNISASVKQPDSPIRSRDNSISPTRKRRRRRTSPNDLDLHYDNSLELPIQDQSTPVVPNILPSSSSAISRVPPDDAGDQSLDNAEFNRLAESGLIKEKIEPQSEFIEPKTEYLEETNADDSVEDLTLDDDDDMDGMDMGAGPSHSADNSNQGYNWPMTGDRPDEMFMTQDAVGAQRDSQEPNLGIKHDILI